MNSCCWYRHLFHRLPRDLQPRQLLLRAPQLLRQTSDLLTQPLGLACASARLASNASIDDGTPHPSGSASARLTAGSAPATAEVGTTGHIPNLCESP